MPSKRPENHDDLMPYRRVEELLTVQIPKNTQHAAILMPAIAQVLAQLWDIHRDAINLKIEHGGQLRVERPLTKPELDKELAQAQSNWDATFGQVSTS